MANKLYIADRRMLELAEILKQNGTIKYKQEMWDAIEIKKQAISNIRNGDQHFTVRQIELACKKFGGDANWFFGLSDTVFRKVLPVTKKITNFQKNTVKMKRVKNESRIE
jgi:hypothetical protein